jgi:hypothetical protein
MEEEGTEKASGGRFARSPEKRTKDENEDEHDWDMTLNTYRCVFSACVLRRRAERIPEGQMTVARRFIAGFQQTRIGGWACRRIGVSRQSHRLPYLFLMRTNRPLGGTPIRPYAHMPNRVCWRPRSNFKRPSGTQIPMDGQPGDKSPGYYRVSSGTK